MRTLLEAYHYSLVYIKTEKDGFGVDEEPTEKGLLVWHVKVLARRRPTIDGLIVS